VEIIKFKDVRYWVWAVLGCSKGVWSE